MTSYVYEASLKPEERVKVVEWLLDTQNSFLQKITKESTWGVFRDFFTEFASKIQTKRIAFARDFAMTYYQAADDFQHPQEGEYDSGTKSIVSQSFAGIIENLLRNNIIPRWFAKETKEHEAARRITPFAKNN